MLASSFEKHERVKNRATSPRAGSWAGLPAESNACYDYAKDIRAALVSQPLGKQVSDTEHTRHWGAFCAASVEFLCDRYDVLCPQWVYEPYYRLFIPWYGDNIVNLADTV